MEGLRQRVHPDDALASERRHLVRLCAHLSGSPEVAEDLAQETLIEAWRHEQDLLDPAKRLAWLSGIARNVCRRWQRARGRESLRLTDRIKDTGQGEHLDLLADDADVEIDLERSELALLLDRAMALLSPETRVVLVERFINELSHAEIAEQLSLTEGTVKVRVHRGKLTLRRLLATHFAEDLHAYGFAPQGEAWHETRVWCSGCGTHRLRARIAGPPDSVSFRCPQCHPDQRVTVTDYSLANPHFAALIGGLRRPATILKRGAEWCHQYYSQARPGGQASCTRCGRPAPVRTFRREAGPGWVGDADGLYVSCDACGEQVCISRHGLVSALPAVQQFRRQEPRIRIVPRREIEVGGRGAVVTSVESVTSAVRLDVVTDADTFRVLGVHRGSGSGLDL